MSLKVLVVAVSLLLSALPLQAEQPLPPVLGPFPPGVVLPGPLPPHPGHPGEVIPAPPLVPGEPVTEEPINPYIPAPREAWWFGHKVPYGHQPTVYYPAWDRPIRTLLGFRPFGYPADVPHGVALPYYYPIGR